MTNPLDHEDTIVRKNIDYCVDYALRDIKTIDRDKILGYVSKLDVETPNSSYLKEDELLLSFGGGDLGVIFHKKYTEWSEVHRSRWSSYQRHYEQLAASNPHWNFDMVLSVHDFSWPMYDKLDIPRLSICVDSDHSRSSNIIPVPVWDYMDGVKNLRAEDVRDTDIRFSDKRKVICFVGEGAGRNKHFCKRHGDINQRVDFCNWAHDHTEDIYARIIKIVAEGHPMSWTWDDIRHGPADFVNIEKQLKYRYLLNIDGNVTSWTRFPWQMSSNSVCMVLRPKPHEHFYISEPFEWYYPLFEKFEKDDIPLPFVWVTKENILDTKKRLDDDDDACLEQIEHGNSFVKNYLTIKSMTQYTTALFERINGLMK